MVRIVMGCHQHIDPIPFGVLAEQFSETVDTAATIYENRPSWCILGFEVKRISLSNGDGNEPGHPIIPLCPSPRDFSNGASHASSTRRWVRYPDYFTASSVRKPGWFTIRSRMSANFEEPFSIIGFFLV
jgi:hypothetical protein